MTIKINEEVIEKLLKEGFYPNEMFSLYFALKALGEKETALLDSYDDYNTSKRAIITYQTLYRRGLIEKNGEDGKVYFNLTEKGTELLNSLTALTPEEVKIAGEKPSVCKEWIDEWIKLFPVKSGNRLLRSDKKSCEIKMNTFIKAYKYDRDTIFAATKSYLIEQSGENFKYTKNAVYFINKKDEGSALAGWCKLIKDKVDSGGKADDGSHIKLIQNVN